MGKLLLVLLVLSGAAVLNPDVRERIKPYVEFALDPVYGWTAQSRVAEITRTLEGHVAAGRPLPKNDKELHDQLRQEQTSADAHLDPWGNPYFVRRATGSIRIGSAGPDRKPATPDDILGKALPAPLR